MIWARLLLALVVAAGFGFGAFFVALGLTPEFTPSGPPERSDREVDWLHLDSPELEAEKHRFAVAAGIGCVAGTVAVIGLLFAYRRWIVPPAALKRK